MPPADVKQPFAGLETCSPIAIRDHEAAAMAVTDGTVELASASPTGKKKGGLLKSIKRIGTLFSAQSTGAIRANSNPSQRNGLAHALSTPDELPSTLPISVSSNNSPSCIEIARNQRDSVVARGVSSCSPPNEPHSPGSPFPSASQGLLASMYKYPIDGDPTIRCNLRKNASSMSESQQAKPSSSYSSPAAASPTFAATLSAYDSISSSSSRPEKSSEVLSPPVHFPSPPLPSPDIPRPATTLLALNSALPAPMRRRYWCLDDYQVVKRLYKGASASVYKATCLRSGMAVALKVYFLSRVPRNVVHMIKREIDLHHRLVHPNIISLYAAFLDGDRIVLVQEYAARGDLFRLLRQMGGRMSEAQVSELMMRPFLDALAYLHSQGVCHRDVKPENILYNENWVLKVADFGVSINLNDERAVTRAGTVDYMAPEVTRCPLKAEPGDNKDNEALAYSSAVDVWAAGVLAYELLVGFTPILSAPHMAAVPNTGLSPQPRAPAAASGPTIHYPNSLGAAARNFISRALAPNPIDRPTAKELLRDPWLAAGALPASVTSSTGSSGSPSGLVTISGMTAVARAPTEGDE